jgi:hypothetical protein
VKIHFKKFLWAFNSHHFRFKHIVRIADGKSVLKKIAAEPENKFTFMVFRNHYHRDLKNDLRSELPSSSLLEEDIAKLPIVLLLPRFLPYTKVFKEKIDDLIASGLVQRWSEEFFLDDKVIRRPEEIDPQVLTLFHLFDGFVAFCACLIISSIVFVVELLAKCLSVMVNRLTSD